MFPTSTTSVFEVTLNSIKQLNFCRKFCLVSLLDSHFISVSKCNNHLILKVSNEYQPMIGYSNFCLNSEKDHPHGRVALFPPCVLAHCAAAVVHMTECITLGIIFQQDGKFAALPDGHQWQQQQHHCLMSCLNLKCYSIPLILVVACVSNSVGKFPLRGFPENH